MDEANLIEKLTRYCLTRQEATIYLCLYQNESATGYEIAKQTGMSRSNVYNALKGLEEKGAACLDEGNSKKYMAVDISEFCNNFIRRAEQTRNELINEMPVRKPEVKGYLTITGHENIMNRIYNMLGQCRHRIYFCASSQIIRHFIAPIQELIKEQKKVVILTREKPDLEDVIFYRSDYSENEIHLIIDSKSAISGECGVGSENICLYSEHNNFVRILKQALSNTIKLAELEQNKE